MANKTKSCFLEHQFHFRDPVDSLDINFILTHVLRKSRFVPLIYTTGRVPEAVALNIEPPMTLRIVRLTRFIIDHSFGEEKK